MSANRIILGNHRYEILAEIDIERDRQNSLFGVQDLSPMEFLMILGEEVGEANKAALEQHFKTVPDDNLAHYREELIQVAAVCVQAIECLDRRKK
jgi:NTP pyrophosphatase (non-canonical NTP hydrolase)